MRLGRVYFNASYVVDLDNQDMVDHAKECVYEDVENSVKHNEVACWIYTEEDPSLTEGDIAEFMTEDIDNEDYLEGEV